MRQPPSDPQGIPVADIGTPAQRAQQFKASIQEATREMIAVLKVPFEQFARARSAELLNPSQSRHEAAKAKEVGRLNLTDVLAGPQHAAILKEFQDHCRQQRMLEGLDFIVSSTEFARLEEPGAVLTQGVRLYQEFLSPQSGREINISFVQREKIKRAGRDLSRLLHPEDQHQPAVFASPPHRQIRVWKSPSATPPAPAQPRVQAVAPLSGWQKIKKRAMSLTHKRTDLRVG